MPRERAHNPRTPQRCSGSRWNTRRRTRCRYRRHHRNPLHRRRHRCGTERHGAPDTGRLALPADAPRDHVDRSARHRPGLPAAQEPGERAHRSTSRSAWRTSSTPRRPTSAAPPRCCVEVDPVGLVRGATRPATAFSLAAVRERPAVRRVVVPQRRDRASCFGTALAGRSEGPAGARRDAAPARGAPAGACRCRGGEELAAPAVRAARLRGRRPRRSRSTRRSPTWGDSRYLDVTLRGTRACSRDLLEHLYVLLPVLDDDKHYWVGDRRGRQAPAPRAATGSAAHPRARADHAPLPPPPTAVAHARSPRAARSADDDAAMPTRRAGRTTARKRPSSEPVQPQRPAHRRGAVRRSGRPARGRVVDLGCGDGQAAPARCSRTPRSSEIVGVDVSYRRARGAPRDACTSTRCRRASASGSSCSRARSRTATRGSRASTRPPSWRSSSTSTRRAWRRSSASLFAYARPRHRDRHDAERRVQRAVRGPAGRAAAPPRPPLRVDPRRVRGVGRRRGRAPRLHGAAPRPSGPIDPEVGAADADGGVPPMTRSRSRSCRWSCSSACPARASPRSRARHFLPTEVVSSDFCRGLVGRRRERPVRHRRRRSRCCTSSPASGSSAGRLTVVDATNVQPEARSRSSRWPARTTCSPSRSCSTCRSDVCARAQRRPARTATSGRTSSAPARQLRRSIKGLQREGFRRCHVLRGARRDRRRRASCATSCSGRHSAT